MTTCYASTTGSIRIMELLWGRYLAGCEVGRVIGAHLPKIQNDAHENKMQRRPHHMEVKNDPKKHCGYR